MQSNTIFTSVRSEKRWVKQMSRTFPQEHTFQIDHNVHPCVPKVPKTLTQTKPEAYTPRLLGLGPYHHLPPELYKLQRIKLAAIKTFLNNEQKQKFHLVVEALTRMESVVRSCYDQYLDLDPSTLAWIVAIDSVYLLHVLQADDSSNPESETVAGDVFMLENQMPVILLHEVSKVLEILPFENMLFDRFCKKYSPLELNQKCFISSGDTNQVHLLHRMHHLIVSNRGINPFMCSMVLSDRIICKRNMVKQGVDVAASFGIPGAKIVLQHLTFMDKIPWDMILALFGTGDPDEQNNLIEEIDIPSVSQLRKIARIEFEITTRGIRGVKFEEAERKFNLPVIKMNPNTEIILRNLVAFEAAVIEPGSALELAEYLDLMCGIVDTKKDVEILRSKGIIRGDLLDEEIVRVFNGIRKSTGKGEKTSSNVKKAVDAVSERYNNIVRVKVIRLIKSHVRRSQKFHKVASTVMLLMLLTFHAYCEVYGWRRRWFE